MAVRQDYDKKCDRRKNATDEKTRLTRKRDRLPTSNTLYNIVI